MRKTILILLILVLLISVVPFSLASYGQENRVKSEKNEVDDDDEDEVDGDTNETEDDEADDDLDDDNEKEGIQIGGKSRVRMRLDKVSEISLENIKKARENYLKARERYEEAKEKARENKERIRELKEELKEELKKCEDDESDECIKVRDEAKNETKEFLGRSADAIISALEIVKARIQESDRFTDEEKNEMISSIDAKIKEIQDAKGSIENAVTGQEIKEAAKKINAAWKNTKPELEKFSYGSTIARLGNVVDKFEKVSDRLENTINKLVEQGKDVTELNTLKKSYEDKVQGAINKLKEASDLVENKAYDEAKAKFNEAKIVLKEANNLLKELVKKIKEAGNELVLGEQENE